MTVVLYRVLHAVDYYAGYYCGCTHTTEQTIQTLFTPLIIALAIYDTSVIMYIPVHRAVMVVTCDASLGDGYVGIEFCGYHGILVVGGQTLRALAIMSQPYGMEGAGWRSLCVPGGLQSFPLRRDSDPNCFWLRRGVDVQSAGRGA